MDKLLGWVKQIFVISILSELVIHILPDEKYEGVVRLLCGCMITAACIMPVLNIINAEYDADIDLFAKTSQISELRSQIRFSGKDSSDVMIEKYIETQQEFVTRKVMEEGFTPSEVEIVIDTDEDSDTYLDVQKINIAIDKKDKKIILLAGPSSSGKTTTTRKLCMFLRSFGLNPKMLSMDDYFVERDETPVDENGEKDYECFEAVDHQLLTEQVALLLKGETVKTPVYSFIEGSKEFIRELKLEKNDILLVEGIHALNPKVLDTIPAKNKYKIYLSALTELNIDSHNRFSTTDNRLLRRIIRDSRTRGYDVVDTIAIWPKVRAGEEKYIFPYQDEADSTINTALIYELGVLKTYVEPLLYSVDEDSIYYDEAKRLLNLFRLILPIPSEAIPADSILREFVGGSCFHE